MIKYFFATRMDSGNGEESITELKQGDPLLIEMVSQFPCLYNKELKEYRSNVVRSAAWNSIAQIMNMLRKYAKLSISECSNISLMVCHEHKKITLILFV